MKSIEEINEKLIEMKSKPKSFENNIFIDYLEVARFNYSESYLHHLLNKYSYEVQEDSAIVEALKWVLEEPKDEI